MDTKGARHDAGEGQGTGSIVRSEQRAHSRRPCDGWAAFVRVNDYGGKSAVIPLRGEDISTGGIGAYCWTELKPGTRGGLMIKRPGGDHLLLGADVIYCHRRSRLDFDCGLRFTSKPLDVELSDFRHADGGPLNLGPPLVA